MATRNSKGQFVAGTTGNAGGVSNTKTKSVKEFISDTDVQRCVTMLMGIVKSPKAKHADKIKAASYIIDQAKGKARQIIDNNHIIEDIEFPEIFVQCATTPLPSPDLDDE